MVCRSFKACLRSGNIQWLREAKKHQRAACFTCSRAARSKSLRHVWRQLNRSLWTRTTLRPAAEALENGSSGQPSMNFLCSGVRNLIQIQAESNITKLCVAILWCLQPRKRAAWYPGFKLTPLAVGVYGPARRLATVGIEACNLSLVNSHTKSYPELNQM